MTGGLTGGTGGFGNIYGSMIKAVRQIAEKTLSPNLSAANSGLPKPLLAATQNEMALARFSPVA
jgi:hypothetical protein